MLNNFLRLDYDLVYPVLLSNGAKPVDFDDKHVVYVCDRRIKQLYYDADMTPTATMGHYIKSIGRQMHIIGKRHSALPYASTGRSC